MKKQVVVIHGGDAFKTQEEYLAFLKGFSIDQNDFDRKFRTRGWKDSLGERLGSEYEVIQPEMPNSWNCRFAEWKIWFEKIAPFFADEVVLVGHSMGGIFLAKYLSENKFPKKIVGTIMVAAPYDESSSPEALMDFNFKPEENFSLLKEQGGKLVFFQSEDDKVVPFADFEKYKKAVPQGKFVVFKDRGHFNQPEFPEIVSEIKDL
jgi:predicted alpha/beta hydrolase family esterase